jgi:suppressor for copper-sensitivity B
MPPQLDWSGSDNLAAAPVAWPAPSRFESFGLQGYGYDTEVVLPIAARLLRPGEAGAFRLAVTYLNCREICIPGEAELALDLAAGPATASPAAAALERHRARVPATPEAAGITLKAVSTPGGVMVIAKGSSAFAAPDLFLEWTEPGPYRRPALPRPSVALADAAREAIFRVTVHPPMVRPGTSLTVTVTDGPRAVESSLVVQAPPDPLP